jgi:hypothetical protein
VPRRETEKRGERGKKVIITRSLRLRSSRDRQIERQLVKESEREKEREKGMGKI